MADRHKPPRRGRLIVAFLVAINLIAAALLLLKLQVPHPG
jgi:hypothetical protein